MPTSDIRLLRARPTLGVADVPRSLAFYSRSLGFRIETTMGEPASFAILVRDDIGLALVQTAHPAVADFACCYINVHGVEALHESFRQAGARITSPLTRHPWGNHDFVIADPDGHQLAFGESHSDDH